MKKMNPVVHFEMPYENIDRMAKFYERAFGWEMNKLGSEMGNYVVAMTAESDKKGPLKPGVINGGFFEKKADFPDQYPSVVISVENMNDAMNKVRSGGGEILGKPDLIPGVGKYVSFRDTEGNRVSLLEPLDNM